MDGVEGTSGGVMGSLLGCRTASGHERESGIRAPRRGSARLVRESPVSGAVANGRQRTPNLYTCPPMPLVHVAEVLRRYVGADGAIPVEGATVRAALDSLFAAYPALRERTLGPDGALWSYLLVFRNDVELPREGLLDTPLAAGDVVEIVGAAEGGGGDGCCDGDGVPAPGGADARDVRMRGFTRRTSVARALEIALDGAAPVGAESVPVQAAAGRVLAEDVVSSVDVPAFRRSAMDGYAVRAEDTFGATQWDPVALTLVGESMPGSGMGASGPLFATMPGRGTAVRIMTGAPVPDGADAVVPAESAAESAVEKDGRVLVDQPVTPGKNVGRVGEDVARGDLLLRAGRVLRPQDVGLLASVGVGAPRVVTRSRVAVLVTGNELLAPGETPRGTSIVDSNTPMLSALVALDGGEVVRAFRLTDDAAAIRTAIEWCAAHADVLIAAGGTSVGREDFLPVLVREMGELPVHGVAMRPSSPTGIGRIGKLRVFLLPGNPVSCLAAYDVFAGPVVRALAGLPTAMPYECRRMRVAAPISSQVGRTDYCRVVVTPRGVEPLAIAGASILSSTTRADGFVLVPENSEGYAEGAEADVFLYDAPGHRTGMAP